MYSTVVEFLKLIFGDFIQYWVIPENPEDAQNREFCVGADTEFKQKMHRIWSPSDRTAKISGLHRFHMESLIF